MRKKLFGQKGFTMIEMLVAMSIFVIFTGVLISSYTNIVKAQREANDYRGLYSEARRVFDKLTEEIRDGAVYYPSNINSNAEYANVNHDLTIISQGGEKMVSFVYKEGEEENGGNILFQERHIGGVDEGSVGDSYPLILDEDGRVSVSVFNVFVSPVGDPYRDENVLADSLQFQPKVTVFARFELKRRGGGDPYVLDLQTTVSSRFYTKSPAPSVLLPQVWDFYNFRILNND